MINDIYIYIYEINTVNSGLLEVSVCECVVKKVFTSQNDLLVIRLYIHLWMNRSYVNNERVDRKRERERETVIVDKHRP